MTAGVKPTCRPLSRARWAYIKALGLGSTYAHISARIVHVPTPGNLGTKAIVMKRDRRFPLDPLNPAMIGSTYNVGRNAEKRARRGVRGS